MVLTVVVFLIILSILVLVHEFGHFLIGRLAGIGVLEFALGLPFTKPIFSKKLKSGMRLSLYPLLFGGFVKLLGEEGSADKKDGVRGKYFYQANVWARIAVVVAGVAMNFLLAVIAFYVFLSLSNFQVIIPKLADYHFLSPNTTRVIVTYTQPNSPADSAKLVPGDVILSADNREFSNLKSFQTYIKSRGGEETKLVVANLSLTSNREIILTPRQNPPTGQGALGVGIAEGYEVNFPSTSDKIFSGGKYTVDMLGYNLRVISSLIFSAYQTKNVAPVTESVSGPVGIASAIDAIIKIGGRDAVLGLINLLGLLSVSLAFMNILPIPALDGGRAAFLLIEAFLGKKLAAKHENSINQVGMFFLLGLIILITYNDITKALTPK